MTRKIALLAIGGNEHRQLNQAGNRHGHIRREAGIVFSPVEHEDNVQSSDEEVARIQEIVGELIGRPMTGSDGSPAGVITLKDILFVAPYNMQVRRLRSGLLTGARVGSVDGFASGRASGIHRGRDVRFSARNVSVSYHSDVAGPVWCQESVRLMAASSGQRGNSPSSFLARPMAGT